MSAVKVKIGIDARILRGAWVGVSRYLMNYLQYLVQDPDKEIYLYSNTDIVFPIGFDQSRVHVVVDAGWCRVPGTLWLLFRVNMLLKRSSIDVFWGIQQGMPYFRSAEIKYVVTIHDVVHLKFPKSMQLPGLLFNHLMFPLVLAKADHLIFVSNTTRQDVLDGYRDIPVAGERASVIYQVVPCAQAAATPVRVHGNYLFTVGSLEPRKNLERLLQVFAQLRGKLPDLRLKIAGGQSWGALDLPHLCQQLAISDAVDILGGIDDAERERLLSTCTAYVFPSLYEGYGIPILEAVQHAPVIASDIAIFRELNDHMSGLQLVNFSDDVAVVADRMYALLSGEVLPICKIRDAAAAMFSPNLSYQRVAAILS